MKKQLVIIGIVAILVCVGLSGCQSQGLRVYRIGEQSTNYVNITEQQMQNFPHLKEAILTNKSVETPPEEMNRLRGVLEFFDTEIIKYLNEYYEIGFWFAD